MRFLLNKRLHVNMGNYEHSEVVATVEVDTVADAEVLKDHEVDPTHPEDITAFLRICLDDLLESGIAEAATYTDAQDSFVLPLHKDTTKGRRN